MDMETLKNQAWALLVKINTRVDSECVGKAAKPTLVARKERLMCARTNAYIRFLRRQRKGELAAAKVKVDG